MRARGWRTRSAARELWVESLERFFFFFFFNYSRNERKSLLAPDTAARTPGQLPACEVAACFPRLTKTLVGAGWRVGEGLSANFFVRKLAKQCARPRGVRGRSARRRPARAEGSHPPCLPAPPSCPSAPARRTFSGEGRWVAAQGALRRRRGLARGARNAHKPALLYQAAGNAERRELFPVRKKSVDPGFEGSGRWRP